MKVENTTAIITGGASGLGGATTEMIVAGGGNVVVIDINEETGNAMVEKLGDRCTFVKTNVTDEKEVQAAIDTAISKYGRLDAAINCAGIGSAEKVVGKKGAHSLAHFQRVIDINLVGTFNVVRLAAEAMAKTEPNEELERGVLINTASVAAFDGQIGQAAYTASKAGIVGMTLPIARELADSGIRILTIAPGIFETPMMAGLPENARISLGKQVPFPSRLGRPDEYANLAKFMIENPMINGEVVRLDGSIRMTAR